MFKYAQQPHEAGRCLCSVVDFGRSREVLGWVWGLARVAAATYAER
jgi:hypothetical protein